MNWLAGIFATIKSRLIFLGLSVVIGLTAVYFVGEWSRIQMQNFAALEKSLHSFNQKAHELNRLGYAFNLEHDLLIQDEFTQLAAHTKTHLNDLTVTFKEQKIETSSLTLLAQEIQHFIKINEDIFALNTKIGLTSDQGERGKLRQYATELQTYLKKSKLGNLNTVVLSMLVLANEYQETLDPKLFKKFNIRSKILSLQIRKVKNEEAKRRLPSLVKNYVDSFTTLAADYQILYGENKNSGLAKELKTTRIAVNDKIEEINSKIIQNAKTFEDQTRLNILLLSLFIIIVNIVGLVAILISILRPINNLTDTMTLLSEGNLNAQIGHFHKKNEIGVMARAVEVFKNNMVKNKELEARQLENKRIAEEEKNTAMLMLANDFEKDIGSVVTVLNQSAQELQVSSLQMSQVAKNSTERASQVSTASGAASQNVSTVAAAAEELTNSVASIRQQAENSGSVSEEAVKIASEASKKVEALSEMTNRIGEVVTLITNIADQTNLLALNATIEAARAGDAGKGFAVVASEVKNLATQTAQATDEISTQIGEVQNGTNIAVASIAEISKIIDQMKEISLDVSQAMQAQASATEEIVLNITEAANGTKAVNQNISMVENASRETGVAATQIESSSAQLNDQAEQLNRRVSHFLSGIRQDNVA